MLGVVAHLGERLHGMEKVASSSLVSSTIRKYRFDTNVIKLFLFADRNIYPFHQHTLESCKSVKRHFYEVLFLLRYCYGTKASSTGR